MNVILPISNQRMNNFQTITTFFWCSSQFLLWFCPAQSQRKYGVASYKRSILLVSISLFWIFDNWIIKWIIVQLFLQFKICLNVFNCSFSPFLSLRLFLRWENILFWLQTLYYTLLKIVYRILKMNMQSYFGVFNIILITYTNFLLRNTE